MPVCSGWGPTTSICTMFTPLTMTRQLTSPYSSSTTPCSRAKSFIRPARTSVPGVCARPCGRATILALHGSPPCSRSTISSIATLRSSSCRSAQEHKLGVVTYSPLARGILTAKYKPGEAFPEGSRAARNDKRMREAELRNESLTISQQIADHCRAKGTTGDRTRRPAAPDSRRRRRALAGGCGEDQGTRRLRPRLVRRRRRLDGHAGGRRVPRGAQKRVDRRQSGATVCGRRNRGRFRSVRRACRDGDEASGACCRRCAQSESAISETRRSRPARP